MANTPTIGDPTRYIYFDTEFTSLSKDADLLSIGLVDCEGKTFYAEFNDFDENKLTPWVIKNVVLNMVNPPVNCEGDHWTIKGSKSEVRTQLMFWLMERSNNETTPIQFVSDVCHYDFVLLIDLLSGGKTVFEIPGWISNCCLDINQDLGNAIQRNKPDNITDDEFNKNYIPIYAAFDISRETYMKYVGIQVEGNKHNSLYDAQVIRAIHRQMWAIPD